MKPDLPASAALTGEPGAYRPHGASDLLSEAPWAGIVGRAERRRHLGPEGTETRARVAGSAGRRARAASRPGMANGCPAGTHQTRSWSAAYRWAYSMANWVFPTPPSPCTALAWITAPVWSGCWGQRVSAIISCS
jgi:hypothetical protein